jgi:excisionase family DNA binding protein
MLKRYFLSKGDYNMTTSGTNLDTAQRDVRAYSIEAAAELLSISSWTIRKWIAEKRISSCKLGSRRVIPASEIKRLLDESLQERNVVRV